jgi:protein TonB
MNISLNYNYINPNTEKFTVALFIAILVHIVVIYSVGFMMPKSNKLQNSTMEIILVPKKNSENVSKKADYLAQISQKGEGEMKNTKNNLSLSEISNFIPPSYKSPTKKLKILTTEKLAQHSVSSQPDVNLPKTPISKNTFLINASAAKLAKIQAELDAKFNIYTKQPRQKYINASTKEYNYANYMDAWRRKVETIGSTNYPNKARQQQLSGSLVLDVVLNSNGTIHKVVIKQSSGYKILDEAALRIVRLAAPFAPFPEAIRNKTDLLHITRTWDFRYNNLSSR